MELGKHSDCQRSTKARASLLARSWVQRIFWDLSLQWLSQLYTHERANKLVLAFGDRWQSECFPKSEATYFEAGVLLGTRGSLNFFPVDSSVLPP